MHFCKWLGVLLFALVSWLLGFSKVAQAALCAAFLFETVTYVKNRPLPVIEYTLRSKKKLLPKMKELVETVTKLEKEKGVFSEADPGPHSVVGHQVLVEVLTDHDMKTTVAVWLRRPEEKIGTIDGVKSEIEYIYCKQKDGTICAIKHMLPHDSQVYAQYKFFAPFGGADELTGYAVCKGHVVWKSEARPMSSDNDEY